MYMPAVTVPMESGRVLRIHSPIHGPSTLLPVPWSLVAVIRDVDVPRHQTDRRHLSACESDAPWLLILCFATAATERVDSDW